MSRLHRLGTWAQRFPGTFTLGLVTLAMFGLQAWAGGTYDVPAAVQLGALLAERIREHGEYFRVVMPMFLHMGPVHFGLNMLAFVQLALLVEYVWGTQRLLVFYGLCGIAAALVTASFSPMGRPTLGASGAIMGLAGLLLGARYMGAPSLRLFLGEVLGRRLFWGVLFTFGVGLLLEAFYPIVDNWGHLGGFLMGVLFAAATPDPDSGEWPVRAAGALLVPLFVGSAAWTAERGDAALQTLDADLAWEYRLGASRHPDTVQGVDMLVSMVRHYEDAGQGEVGLEVLRREVRSVHQPLLLLRMSGLLLGEDDLDDAAMVALQRWSEVAPDDPMVLNSLAWHLVTHDDPAARDPARAEELVRAALASLDTDEPSDSRLQRAAYLDTLGEALLQLQRYEEALEVQSESLAIAEELEMADLPEIQARHQRILQAVGPQ